MPKPVARTPNAYASTTTTVVMMPATTRTGGVVAVDGRAMTRVIAAVFGVGTRRR